MSDTGTNPGAAAAEPASSALSDGGLAEFFTPEPTPTPAPAAEGAPAQPAPAAPADPAAPAVPAAAPAPVPDATATEIAALRSEIAQLRNPKPAEGAPAGGDKPDPLNSVPDYNFELPIPLMEQLNAEDMGVRAKALSATISAVGKTVHNAILQQMNARIDQVLRSIPETVGRTTSDTAEAQRVSTDFYGKYPEYNTPLLKPIVQMAVLQVGRQNPQLAERGWTPELRDKVGEFLKANVPLAARPAATAPKPAAAAPPAMMGSGARPAAPVLGGNEEALAEMFG